MSSVLALSIFMLGMVGEEVWTYQFDKFKPESWKTETEIAADALSVKTNEIAGTISDIEDMIKKISNGDQLSSEELQTKMSELLEGIDGLKPQLDKVENLRRDFFTATAREKYQQIDQLSYSKISDFNLLMNQGATVCKERYSVGLSTTSGTSQTDTTPYITFRSPEGKEVHVVNMRVGDGLRLEDGDRIFSITYNNYELVDDFGVYGINVNCPS
ncbi:hypothetical protein [Iodidimonas muriae]|nr:hypothetical protein [Iodidimonas muriae]